MRFCRVCVCLCLLLAVLPHMSASEPQWIEVRSEHFTVITDDGEKSGRHVAELFEQMRAAFGLIFMRTKVNQPIPLQIIAFRNNKELQQNSPLYKGKVIELAGYFQPGEDRDFILLDIGQEENWQTIFHEYAHLLLDGNFPRTAPWFDEGFAEYLSTMKISKDGTVTIGNLLPGAELLDQASKFHLLDLFQVNHFSETYNKSGEHRDMFYVESWLVAHYIFDTNQLKQTARYFKLVNEQKMPIPQAVQAAYGMSIDQMEKTIWANWRSGKLYAKKFNEKLSTTTFNAQVRPLDSLTARAQFAELHIHQMDYVDKGTQEYEAILKQDPNQAAAQRGLAYAYLRKRDLAKAAVHYQAAAKLGSDDPRVYYYSAILMRETNPSAVGSDEFMQDLQHAIQLDPQYSEAYGLLALGYMQHQKWAEAEQNIRHAIELSPRDDMNRFNLAVVFANQQKLDDASVILTGLAQSSDPMVANRARDMLASMTRVEVQPSSGEDASAIPALPDKTRTDIRDNPPEAAPAPKSETAAAPDKRPMAFVSGKIMAVDCSAEPAAILTITSAGKTYHLHVTDRSKLVLINADKFSCSWTGVKAAANYRDSGNLEGDLISLELP